MTLIRSRVVALIAVSLAATQAGSALAATGAEPRRATSSTCAFTGQKAPARKAARPAVAVRISNSPDARPQVGVTSADLVIETLVEGGLTRLIGVYQCSDAPVTGPVRSARMDDAEIVTPFARLLAFSGANARVMTALAGSELNLVTELSSADAIFRNPTGSTSIDAVRADIPALRSMARAAGLVKPRSPFSFGSAQSGARVKKVELSFGATDVAYVWRSRRWLRSQDGLASKDADGRRVGPANVIVQEVDASPSAWLFDSLGAPSPRFDLEGSGRAFLFRDGRIIAGRWTDKGAGAPVFKTKKGSVLRLTTGQTWLEMVPSAGGDLSGSISF